MKMKHAIMKRLLLTLLAVCLILSMVGCASVRSILRKGDEADTSVDGSEAPGPESVPATTQVSTLVLVDPADEDAVAGLTENQKMILAEILNQLKSELESRLGEFGIDLDIDEKTCEVSLPTSILFPADSAELSRDGKDFLTTYVTIYNQVILESEYNRYVAYVYIEGHTAPLADSTYESGLPLSRDRANAVRDFILSDEAGTSAAQAAILGNMLIAEGCSNSRPVKNADGSVDLAASRRVTFRVLFWIPSDND